MSDVDVDISPSVEPESSTPPPSWDNTLFHADCRDVLPELPDESVQLTVTSPPYNIQKDYGDYDDGKPIDAWRELVRDVFEELFRVTKPDGKVCINVGFSTGETDEEGRFYRIPLNSHIINIAQDVGFDLFDEYLWVKNTFASHGGGALYGSYPYPTNLMANQQHEYILVFRKWVSDDYYSTREIPEKGTTRREQSALDKETWREYTQSVWEIKPVQPKNIAVDHQAMFPVEIPRRLTKLYSFIGDTVLDPFVGTGTTALAAADENRQFIGIEQNREFLEVAEQRFDGSLERTVRTRKRAKEAQENAAQNGQTQLGLDDL